MSWKLANILAATGLAIVFLAFELGGLSPANAFFWSAAVLTFYTAYQFLRRDGMYLGDALSSIFVRPTGSSARMRGYITYMGCAVLGVFVAIQAITTTI